MEQTAKVFQLGERQEAVNERGTWRRQQIVVETQEQYPKKIALQLWNDEVAKTAALHVGDTLTFNFVVELREYNGKWYTDVRAFNLRVATQIQAQQPVYAAPQPVQVPQAQPQNFGGGGWPEPNPLLY